MVSLKGVQYTVYICERKRIESYIEKIDVITYKYEWLIQDNCLKPINASVIRV